MNHSKEMNQTYVKLHLTVIILSYVKVLQLSTNKKVQPSIYL